MFQSRRHKNVAVLIGYCAIVIGLLAVTPWLDWSRHGNVWLVNLACLPVLPGSILFFRK